MNRTDVLNLLADYYQYQTYLEIGVRHAKDNFNKVRVPHKFGIEPKLRGSKPDGIIWGLKSDEAFKRFEPDTKFDLIFVDGDHTEKQVIRDVDHSLRHLSDNGTIVLHDVDPPDAWHARPRKMYRGGNWSGQVWRAWVELRMRTNLTMFTVNCDYGVGVIRRGHQWLSIEASKCMTVHDFFKYREKVLNLVPAERGLIVRKLDEIAGRPKTLF